MKQRSSGGEGTDLPSPIGGLQRGECRKGKAGLKRSEACAGLWLSLLVALGIGLQCPSLGAASIQSLIDAYLPGDPPILLPPGVFLEAIIIDRNLVLSGSGATNTFLLSDDSGPAISISPDVTVTISALTITDSGWMHPAVVNRGRALFQACTISSNITAFAAAGFDNFGDLLITNCLILGNRSDGPSGIENMAGGSLSVFDSRFEGNRSWLWAGAIWNVGTASVARASFDSNAAQGASAIYNWGSFTGTDLSIYGGDRIAGGAFGNSGTAYLARTLICSNDHSGIYNVGTLVVDSSAICFNLAESSEAGGIQNDGILAMTNSTISGNLGGNAGGIFNSVSAAFESCTVVSNQATASSASGGIYNSGALSVGGVIIAGNVASSSEPSDLFGPIDSLGFNLIQNTNGGTINGISLGNIYGTDPLLGPLADNGGSTLTHALLPGSAAIDHGNPAATLKVDQRGLRRAQDGNADCIAVADIGAFELHDMAEPSACEITHNNSGIQIRFHGSVDASYVIEAKSDLLPGNWTAVGHAIPSAAGMFELSDGTADPARFYRIKKVLGPEAF
jgi:hypothetical protein